MVRVWNKLPVEAVSVEGVNKFRKLVDETTHKLMTTIASKNAANCIADKLMRTVAN